MKDELLEEATNFFNGSPIPRFFTLSYIVLITKVKVPNGFDKFQPISLCSVAYKIFSKIILDTLTNYLTIIISQEQGAFLPGRSIFDNITLA